MSARIAKAIAHAGLCSRREAERWIEAGRVRVNGALVISPACVVGEKDRVEVDGKPLAPPSLPRLWRYHKPPGLITTQKDERGRPTVFETLPVEIGRVISVGRLDKDTQGLLLLTNDGGLARSLELPSSGWKRTYRAQVEGGALSAQAIERLAKGITIKGIHYRPIKVAPEGQEWVRIVVKEGKKREVREALAYVGHPVLCLIRIIFGPFGLDDLPQGALQEIPKAAVAALCASFRSV